MEALGGLVSEDVSLEVRWLRPGTLSTSMIDWFNPFADETETREDLYLVGRGIEGLSVKVRGGTLLDIKVSNGDQGVLVMAGHARGRLHSWKKWSVPVAGPLEASAVSADWVRVDKERRIARFSLTDGEPTPHSSSAVGERTTCAVELTEVLRRGEEPWWTLGFEAAGRPDTLRKAIEATAALVFADHPPVGQLSVSESMSYADWLRRSVPDP